ncbi:hypothetical protein [Roseisolibacter sp. H3M3-2]|uniref:hypothetical protein n=1 Tax=Roseisolibacter sp. H3M3-2 TaxID=3031323 RepID=UPI0023DCCD97|nr:hypothetical protein [Roseisolibacter sp. H3M3-2]MDF1504981.1 hypothetical protein [Roseisolibacter sp. H3M3-2]
MTPTVLASDAAAPRIAPAERWAALSGVAASLLAFFSGAFAPNPPTHGTDAVLLAHFRTHHDGTMRGVFALMLAAMALLVFAAAVANAARRAGKARGRDAGLLAALTLLTGAAAVGMLVAAQAGAAATAVVGHHAADAALPRAFDEIGHMFAHLSVLPLGAFMIAAGAALLQVRLGARWVAAAGIPAGAAMMLSGTWVFVGGDRVHDAGGFAWLAMILWWIAQGVALWWAGRAPAADRRAASATASADALPA